MILSSNENLNPAEGFVLGAAFLIHDLGMGIVAYQEGIEELKKTALWQDTYKALERKTLGSLEKKRFRAMGFRVNPKRFACAKSRDVTTGFLER